MDDKLIGYWIVGIVLGGIVIFNFVIFQKIRKGETPYNSKKYEIYRKIYNSTKNPFLNTNEDMENLSKMVESLKQKDQGESSPD